MVAVQLPGRGDRMAEPCLASIDEIVDSLLSEVAALGDIPLAVFGHSMGATVAFELSRALSAEYPHLPSQLIVSARRPPDILDLRPAIGLLPDTEFLTELERRYGPIPAEIRREPEVLALFLPILKADIRALERHQDTALPGRVACPIQAWGGMSDASTAAEHLKAWAHRTSTRHSCRIFEGGHFYLDANLSIVLRELERLLLGNGVQSHQNASAEPAR